MQNQMARCEECSISASPARHSFVISFAETARRRMYRSHIKRGQIIPERREEKGTGEGRQKKKDLFI